jgi:hypothetical protein
MAFKTGDNDFPFPSWHSQFLFAIRASEIFVGLKVLYISAFFIKAGIRRA